MPSSAAQARDQYRSPPPTDDRAGPGERPVQRTLRMLYVSHAVAPLTQFQVMQIVAASRRHNWRAGLTGCLLFTGSAFAQVLEGPVATVQALVERLAGDPRHTGVRILSNVVADGRRFSNWTMGFIFDTDLSLDVAALLEASTESDEVARRVVDRMARDVFLGTS